MQKNVCTLIERFIFINTFHPIFDLRWPYSITDFDRASWLVCHHYLQNPAAYRYRSKRILFNRFYFFACRYFLIRTGLDLFFYFWFHPRKRGFILFPHIFPQLTDYPNVSSAFKNILWMNFQTTLLTKTILPPSRVLISLHFDLSLAILTRIFPFYIQ